MSIRSLATDLLLSTTGFFSRERCLTIIQFHRIPGEFDPLVPGELLFERFEKILDLLVEQMRVLPLADAIRAMHRGNLPARAVALTFDDGYADWNARVAPSLLARNLPGTFYVTTGQLSDGAPLWHERIAAAIRAAPPRGLVLPKGFIGYEDISDAPTCARLIQHLQERLKYFSRVDRDAEIEKIERQTVGSHVAPLPFTTAHVRELSALGFEIGAHSVNHPILSACSDSEAREEIAYSKETIEELIRAPVTSFAYPNGLYGRDMGDSHVEMAKQCGYRNAVITGGGVARKETPLLLLPRFTPWGPGYGRMALQLVRNIRASSNQKAMRLKSARPLRVMAVENGSGFGGAVTALQTLTEAASPERMQYFVVSNFKHDGFFPPESVASYRVIGNRPFDLRRLSNPLLCNRRNLMVRTALFVLGRFDDLLNRLPYILRLLVHAYRVDPDIIHGNNEPTTNREAMLVARMLRKPYVQHLRGAIAESLHTRWLLNRPDAFVCVSRWLAEELLLNAVPSAKIDLIYDGVRLQSNQAPSAYDFRNELGVPSDAILVAMVGMLVPWKGQDLFLDAVVRMPEATKTVFLVIGDTPENGDESYRDRLLAMLERIKEQRVIFTGKRTDLEALMPQFDVVVSASTDPEPLGLVMLEAMASRCIFVGPAHGAAVEVVDDEQDGFLFAPGSPADLADKIGRAIAAAAGKHIDTVGVARRVLRDFAPARCVGFTELTYRSLSQQRGGTLLVPWTPVARLSKLMPSENPST